MNKKIILSIVTIGMLSNSVYADTSSSTLSTASNDIDATRKQISEYQAGYKILNNESIDKQKQAIAEYDKYLGDSPLKLSTNTNAKAADGQASWSLVNKNCEPEFNMDAAFNDMMQKYEQALQRALDPAMWKQYLMNKSVESTIDAYAYTKCYESSMTAEEQEAISAKTSQCQSTMTKNVMNTTSKTSMGTDMSSINGMDIDAASLAAAGKCASDVYKMFKGEKFQACVAAEKQTAMNFLNGQVKNALDFGMADLGIQQQRCMINKQNLDNQLGNLKLDGMQITGTPPPGTIGSGTIATYHPDGTVTYTAETASSDSGSGGGYTATGSKNMIITDGSLNNVEQNLKVRKEVLEGCQYKVKQMFNGNTTNLDVWSTQIRMVYKIVLFNWCKGVFMDGADASTPPVRYTSGHYDLEVIDGRWDFPYVADHKLPSSPEFSFLNKAQDKVPIIEECIAVSGESPLSYRNPAIVTIENGKHPEYKTVTFASDETPNRFYYFLRNANNSDIYKQPQYASVDVNAAYKEETNYSQFATYQMRTVCRDWAALQIKVITGEIAGLSYIGGNLIDNGQTASDKSMSLMTAADVQIQNERKARLDQLNNLMNTLNAQINAYLNNVKAQSFMNSINFTSGR